MYKGLWTSDIHSYMSLLAILKALFWECCIHFCMSVGVSAHSDKRAFVWSGTGQQSAFQYIIASHMCVNKTVNKYKSA